MMKMLSRPGLSSSTISSTRDGTICSAFAVNAMLPCDGNTLSPW
jgi:hypothetical protein